MPEVRLADEDWQENLKQTQARGLLARRILGVCVTAGPEKIRQAYRAASKATHPDLHLDETGATESFRNLRCVYEYLMHGSGGEGLDKLLEISTSSQKRGYEVDNEWGYWCWWRERFFP